jgi:flavin reductase (DIM6/NTAB) family NADH-FMN oxidoreductase RutF
MNSRFRTIKTTDIRDNVFKLIDLDWMLVTAGTMKRWNTMTASWGALGELWNKRTAFAFVRPTRHTYGFMERADKFTLSFFPEKCRKTLTFCGTHSGRDTDKARATGLLPFAPAPGTVSFRQARLILVCRKLYTTDMDPKRFLDPKLDRNYPKKDYHRLYVGGITRCLTRCAARPA